MLEFEGGRLSRVLVMIKSSQSGAAPLYKLLRTTLTHKYGLGVTNDQSWWRWA